MDDILQHAVEHRKSPVYIEQSRTYLDSLFFKIPSNLFLEDLPDNVEIKTDFGKYEAKFIKEETGLVYIRKLSFYKGEYPSSNYPQLVDFFKKIRRFDKQTVLLKQV